jgi:iron complex outermembrane recepter protein
MRTLLTCMACALSMIGFGRAACATDNSANPGPAADEIAEVVVTGTRIRQSVTEGPTTVTVITADQLESQGFRNVFDALATLPQNSGFTQGADFGNTFTPAANAISLRGLGPNHTLVLFNGRRVADYPIAYDGAVNFVDLASVPAASIERIEILNGGASAIYGSDAIAGVVNVILKDHVDGVDINAKIGTTERGGGNNARFQATGGNTFGKLSTVFALELSKTDPIWSRDRAFMSSTTLRGATPTIVSARQNLDTGNYISPLDGCAAQAGNFSRSVALTTVAAGEYCGSGRAQPEFWTVQTGRESENLYGEAKYELNDHANLFGDVVVGWNKVKNNTRGPSWTSLLASSGYFFNQNSAANESWTRRIAPEEIGGVDLFDRYWKGTNAIATAGIEGDIGESGWKYEAAYNASVNESRDLRPRLLNNVDTYFLGPQLGVTTDGIPIYAPDAQKFGQALTPAQFQTIVGRSESKDTAWLQTASLALNGDVFQLPAGAVKSAGVLEWGTQGFSNIADAQLNDGVFYNTSPTPKVSGSRARYAAAAEFSVPILENLTARLAARWDHYSFASRSNSKPTYDAGLEYRPVKTLLLRANYATSFRAPDMSYIFQSQVKGFFAETTDYYRCRVSNQPLSNCQFANVSPGSNFIQTGNRDLRFENGRSFGYGLQWEPSEHLTLSADYWNIRIDNLVTTLDFDTLLRIEADCRTNVLDPASAQCVDALSRIQRNPPNAVFNPNAIAQILVNPINAAVERTDGVDLGSRVKWQMWNLGNFAWNIDFTKTIKHRFKQFASDPELDLLHSLENPNADNDFPNKLITTLNWALGRWSSTATVTRYGSIVNQAQTGSLTPTALANLSASYRFNSAGSVSVIVNNVFDTIKKDESAGWPFYPSSYYLPYGREWWLEFSYHFGA